MPRTISEKIDVRGNGGRPESPYVAGAEEAMNLIATADDIVRALVEIANQHIASAARLRREALRLGTARRSMTESARSLPKKRAVA